MELFHVRGFERRPLRCHLIKNAAKRPHITLEVVWLISPDLRRRIVRSSGLRREETILGHDLGNVEVGQLRRPFRINYNVRALDVPMHDSQVVERLHASQQLNHGRPKLVLCEVRLFCYVLVYSLKNIALLGIFHDQA